MKLDEMGEEERAELVKNIESQDSPFLRKLAYLLLEVEGLKPDETGGKDFIHDFLASDLSDILKLEDVSEGKVDGAFMHLHVDLCNDGMLEMVAGIGPALSLLLDEVSDVPMNYNEGNSNVSAKDIDWSNEKSRFQESRLITNIQVLKILMYGCFFMGAYSAKSMKTVQSLDKLWETE